MSQVGWGLCLDGFASLSCFVDRVPEISQLGRMVALYEGLSPALPGSLQEDQAASLCQQLGWRTARMAPPRRLLSLQAPLRMRR